MHEQAADLNLFLTLLGRFDLSQCEFTDVPDLLVRQDGEIIGIEHTRIYREDSTLPSGRQLRPQEHLQWQLVSRAHQLFREQSNHLLYLTVSFNEPFNYRRQDIEAEAHVLAQSVLAILAHVEGSTIEKPLVTLHAWQAERLGIPWPSGVSYYMYRTVVKQSHELWGPSYAYMVPTLTTTELERVVREKETRIARYRVRCSTIWLLLVTDTGMPSSHFDVPDDMRSQSLRTAFDRIFVLLPANQQLIELPVQPLT